jgi:hypothetical protein
LRYQSTTGLDHDRIRELVTRIAQVLEPTQRRTGRPPTLDLHRSVLLTLLLRQNLTQTVAADLLGISQPTVSRIFRRLAPLIGQVLRPHTPPLPEALQGRVVLVDGMLIPTDDHATHRKANVNAKHRRAGMTVQVLATLDGTLLAVSDPVDAPTTRPPTPSPASTNSWPTTRSSPTWATRAPTPSAPAANAQATRNTPPKTRPGTPASAASDGRWNTPSPT